MALPLVEYAKPTSNYNKNNAGAVVVLKIAVYIDHCILPEGTL